MLSDLLEPTSYKHFGSLLSTIVSAILCTEEVNTGGLGLPEAGDVVHESWIGKFRLIHPPKRTLKRLTLLRLLDDLCFYLYEVVPLGCGLFYDVIVAIIIDLVVILISLNSIESWNFIGQLSDWVVLR